MGIIFGTDGARGIANSEITCELAMNIGRAVATVLADYTKKRPMIIIGKDTRISSDMLESALTSGICSVGTDAVILGAVPTPAVAFLVKKYSADAGIMISASHNPYNFNGIKIFNCEGYKLPDSMEAKIENFILNNMDDIKYKDGPDIGRVSYAQDASKDYINHIISTINGDLSGIKVAVDCSNGAASNTAPSLFSALGADCQILFDRPDGININEGCGSTRLEALSEYVRTNSMDLGIAFDGDADRCLAVDSDGNTVDGDAIMAICALDMKENGRLKKDSVVGTIMTNLGFTEFCTEHGIQFISAKVGDRYVLEGMLRNEYNFGGEQSGHVIFHDFSTTGDGQLTAVQLLDALKRKNSSLLNAAKLVKKYPQVIKNVEISKQKKQLLNNDPEISSTISAVRKSLEGCGRIIVRESGTEPLIRVMVECKDILKMENLAEQVAKKIKEQLG